MAGPYTIFFDPDADDGEKMGPEVAAEIAFLAPSTVTNGSITEAKLAEDSVSTGKIIDLNVTTDKLADGAVTTAKLAPEAVTTEKIDDGAVTPVKTGTGVPTIVDSADVAIEVTFKRVTIAQLGVINAGTPDPNVIYLAN